MKGTSWTLLLLVAVVALAGFTVHKQMTHLPSGYLETRQIERHLSILNGTANYPHIYRQVSERAIVLYSRMFTYAPKTKDLFVSARLFQQIALLLLAYAVYRKMGLKPGTALLGLGLFTLCAASAWRDSNLSFETYSEVMLMLAAVGVFRSYHHRWLVPISILAAFNREV